MPAPTTVLPLDDHLCFALYGASMAVLRAYKPVLDRMSITYPQYLVLAALWERDGRSISEIAEMLSLELSTVTPLSKRLEAAGLIERRRSATDGRQVIVTLTDRGRAMQACTQALAKCLLQASGLPEQSLRAVAEELRTLRNAINAGRAPGASQPPQDERQAPDAKALRLMPGVAD